MSISIDGWGGDDTLELTLTDMLFNEHTDSLSEEEVVDLTVSLLASMKDKPAMQAAMERKLEVLAKELRGSDGC